MAGLLCAAATAAPIGGETECSCARGRLHNVWCVPCKVGYVASLEVKSYILFEALDAHGHDVDTKNLQCAGCRFVITRDAWCGDCRIGYVKEHAYFSKLTYVLALGEPLDTTKITCRVCKDHAADRKLPLEADGWCEACGIGIVGNTAYRDRKTFKKARREYERLLRAVEKSAECEMCAAAMIYDRRCPTCRISYENGKAVKVESPATTDSP